MDFRLQFGLDRRPAPAVLAMGSFDGVHRGHRMIAERVLAEARRLDVAAEMITFDPHPRCVVDPDRCPILITSVDERGDLLAGLGIDRLTVMPFDLALARTPAADFLDQVRQSYDLSLLVCGPDYAVGREREGDLEFIRQYAGRHGFAVEVVDPVMVDGTRVSSSEVRRRLFAGDIEGANLLLGYEFCLHSYVERGEGRGSRIGFPTANIAVTPNKAIPARGVYAVRVEVLGRVHGGVLNIGYRPTFGGDKMTVEAHIFDFAEDIYRQKLKVHFVQRLREEKKFSGVEELVAQIGRDAEEARALVG